MEDKINKVAKAFGVSVKKVQEALKLDPSKIKEALSFLPEYPIISIIEEARVAHFKAKLDSKGEEAILLKWVGICQTKKEVIEAIKGSEPSPLACRVAIERCRELTK